MKLQKKIQTELLATHVQASIECPVGINIYDM